jgi:hypothetical protein
MRARPGRGYDQVRQADDGGDSGCDGGRRIDDKKFEAQIAQPIDIIGQMLDGGFYERRRIGGAFIPLVREAALRVRIQQSNGSLTHAFGLDSDMTGQGRFPCAAFLGCECQHLHSYSP